MTNERILRRYLDLLAQVWPLKPADERMREAYTLGLSPATYSGSAATIRLDATNTRTWNLDAGMIEKHVTAFETWFALASISINYTSAARSAVGSNATLGAASTWGHPSKPMFPAGGETVGE